MFCDLLQVLLFRAEAASIGKVKPETGLRLRVSGTKCPRVEYLDALNS